MTDNGAPDAWPVWSPDGQRIAWVNLSDGYGEIFVMDPDGSRPTRITNDERVDSYPKWMPNGRGIAAISLWDDGYKLIAVNLESGSVTVVASDMNLDRRAFDIAE